MAEPTVTVNIDGEMLKFLDESLEGYKIDQIETENRPPEWLGSIESNGKIIDLGSAKRKRVTIELVENK